ncbi:DMT family transporter [Hoeflea alexandrii]|nr:DMT family transporter [Hoeflea alexandrii]
MGARAVNTGVVAGLFTGMQVGVALFMSQLVVGDVGVGLLGLMRYGTALVCLLPVVFLFRKSPPIAARDWPWIVLLGMGQVGLMITLLNLAVAYTSAARVALIFSTLPAISLCVDIARRQVTGGRLSVLGISLSISGVAVLVGHDAFAARLAGTELIGMVAALAATSIVAVCSSFYRPYVIRYGGARLGVIGFCVSMLPLSLLVLFLPPGTAVADWQASTWWLVLAIGVSSGVGYLLWFHAISRLPATRVTGFLALNPVTAAVLSLIFADTQVTPTLILSVCLVCLGIACFALSPPAKAPDPEAATVA